MSKSYEKILTKNDTGETGAHQAGILVPKSNKELIHFFPVLDKVTFNPDRWINCIDDDGEIWQLRYIYYNGKSLTPKRSTRNEYRITHMTKFFSKWNARSGDSVVFTSTIEENTFKISIKRAEEPSKVIENDDGAPPTVVLKGWRAVY